MKSTTRKSSKRGSFAFTGRQAIASGAVVVVVGVTLAVVFLREDPEKRRGREAVEFEERAYQRRSAGGEGGAGGENLSRARVGELAKMVEKAEQVTPRVLMAEYRLNYRYPLESRPLTKRMSDLIDPWTVHPVREPLYANQPPAAGEKPVYYYTWSAPTYVVTGNKPAVARLTVFEPESDRPVSVRIDSATVFADPEFRSVRIGEAQHNDDASGRHTLTWTPQPGMRLHWGNVRMAVKFRAPNGKLFEVDTQFRSTPNPPAFFTGEIRERLDNGSLKIEVGLDVKKEGKYILEANLFDDSDRPLHWVYVNRYLERGLQFVDLNFFGLVFHDRDFTQGRLVLRQLRGHRMHLPYDPRRLDDMLARGVPVPTTNAPDQEWLPPLGRDYRTRRAYSIGEFARTEYEGDDKAERLKAVRAYASTWERAHGPGPDTALD